MSQHLPLFINNTLSCARETQRLLPDLCQLTPVQPQSCLFHRKGLPPPTAWNSFRLWSLSGFLSLRPLAGDGSGHPKSSACSAVHRTRELFLVAGPWCPKSLQAGRPASHVTDSRAGAELCRGAGGPQCPLRCPPCPAEFTPSSGLHQLFTNTEHSL